MYQSKFHCYNSIWIAFEVWKSLYKIFVYTQILKSLFFFYMSTYMRVLINSFFFLSIFEVKNKSMIWLSGVKLSGISGLNTGYYDYDYYYYVLFSGDWLYSLISTVRFDRNKGAYTTTFSLFVIFLSTNRKAALK